MDSLTIPGAEIDINALDTVVSNLLIRENEISYSEANLIYLKFMEREDSYLCSFPVLESNLRSETKFIALLCLKNGVKYRWLCFPSDFQEQTKNILKNLINFYLDNSGENISHISQVNQILVEIAKYDWPEKWPNFFIELLESFEKSIKIKKNTFSIITMIIDEIDESSENSLTSLRAEEMRHNLNSYLPQIIHYIQESFISNDTLLIQSALTTFSRLVDYFEPDQILSSPILSELIENHLQNPNFSLSVISVLTEILALPSINPEYHYSIIQLFDLIVRNLHLLINDNFSNTPKLSGDETFIECFVSAMTSFLNNYGQLIETPEHKSEFLHVLQWIYNFTVESNQEIFEDCIQYWLNVLRRIYLNLKDNSIDNSSEFIGFLSPLRRTLINRMPSPFHSTNFIDHDGNNFKKLSNFQNFGNLYSISRECIVFLTNFDEEDMLNAFVEKINEINSGNYEIDIIKSLCWAIGALPGAIKEEVENDFVSYIFTSLFEFYRLFQNYEEKLALSIGITFISRQFYSFFQRSPLLLNTITYKLFEFIIEPSNELQEFALEALLTLSQRCKTCFPEDSLITSTLFNGIENFIEPLFSDNVPKFFEICSTFILGISNEDDKLNKSNFLYDYLTSRALEVFESNTQWTSPKYTELSVIFKCISKSSLIIHSLWKDKIYQLVEKIIEIYLYFSKLMNNFPIFLNGQKFENLPEFISLKNIKKDILNIIDSCTNHFKRYEEVKLIISFLIGPLLTDFESSHPLTKTSTVIEIFSGLFKGSPNIIITYVNLIYNKLFFPTYTILIEDFDSFLSIRFSFYEFLYRICEGIDIIFDQFNEEEQIIILGSIKHGCLHHQSTITEISLKAFLSFLRSLEKNSNLSKIFIEKYFNNILLFNFSLISDITLKSSFKYQISLLQYLFNSNFIIKHIPNLGEALLFQFPSESPNQIVDLITGLYNNKTDFNNFHNIIKNFLVSIRKISPLDPDLTILEKERMIQILEEQFKELPGFYSPEQIALNDEEDTNVILDSIKKINL